jgi:hypothetical protein
MGPEGTTELVRLSDAHACRALVWEEGNPGQGSGLTKWAAAMAGSHLWLWWAGEAESCVWLGGGTSPPSRCCLIGDWMLSIGSLEPEGLERTGAMRGAWPESFFFCGCSYISN